MNALIVADCHGRLTLDNLNEHTGLAEGLSEGKPDIALFLGDNNSDDLGCVINWLKSNGIIVPMYGVFGNHDTPSLLSHFLIDNIHLKAVGVSGKRIGGFGGSVKYKDSSSSVLYTNEESSELLEGFTECDILITHSNPQYREYESIDITPEPKSLGEKIKRRLFGYEPVYQQRMKPPREDCHAGLIGIGDYIEFKKPKICLHGHIHERKSELHGSTVVRSCYGIEMINL